MCNWRKAAARAVCSRSDDSDDGGYLQRDGGDAMSAGLFGLLDDVAALARLAAAAGRATAKAAGVVIDDTAVTPQ